MTITRFDNQATFEQTLSTGINLFLGAGFSINAENALGQKLPIGDQLTNELKNHFNVNGSFNLPQISTILENTKRNEFYSFLRQRFTIGNFDARYKCLHKININSIYTTNIDNLIFRIFEDCTTKYLTDVSHEGTKLDEPASIDYSALHGCISNDDRKLIFDTSSLNNAYLNSPRVWDYLTHAVEKAPTLFWGYSLNDSGVIQSLTSNRSLKNAQKPKWITILEKDSDTAPYYESMGFNVIIADTDQILDYLTHFEIEQYSKAQPSLNDEINYYFSKNQVPKSGSGLFVRPISNFFMGAAPTWSDVYSGQVYKTSFFSQAQNLIHAKKNLIVLGGPVTGKSTLMLQLAAFTNLQNGYKLAFNNLSIKNAELLTNVFREEKLIVFIDNLADSIDALKILLTRLNIQVVGFERGHNYGIVSHLIPENRFSFLNVTNLTDQDIQGIYDMLPLDQKKPYLNREKNPAYEKDSIYEFISRNVKFNSIESRYREVLSELETKDILLAEFLVLTSYVHYARTPISFDMLFSYFRDDVDSYEEIYEMRDDLKDLISDYAVDSFLPDDQDYYYPRSFLSAETILRVAQKDTVKNVITKALKNIPTAQIPYYNTYRRYAYDKTLISKVFLNWEEGKAFYEDAYENDFRNPYMLQQGALYLSQKKKHTEAFFWIDKAITQTNDKYFSIRNSHAVILFEANINAIEETPEIRDQLDLSMQILEKCYRADKRRLFHVVRYAEQTKEYSKRYFDEKTKRYVETSIEWLKSEAVKYKWNHEIPRLLREVNDLAR